MLATLMTALFFMVKAFQQLGHSLIQEEPLPYLVHQPLPWQVQYVTQSRRDSGKVGSSRHNSIYGTPGRRGDSSPVPSAGSDEPREPLETDPGTSQVQDPKYQQHKQE